MGRAQTRRSAAPARLEDRGRRRARRAGLYYVNSFDTGIERRRRGKGFTYHRAPSGRLVRARAALRRIEALVIPPAWTEVWICHRAHGHIQARGRDQARRRQYVYHERWRAISEATKYDRMHLLAELLPRVRRRLRRDLRGRHLTRERVLAAVVRLIDRAQVRVGNERYAKERDARGATTLTPDHVEVDGFRISLDFPGKSGRRREIELTDAKAAKVIRQCEEIDGQYLFCYRDDDGDLRRVDSTDVNRYLRDVTDSSVTAKDFRTWWGSVIALAELSPMEDARTRAERKRAVAAAVAVTADTLGNTKAVCRSSYIHPGILTAAESGELPALTAKARRRARPRAEMTVDEVAFAAVLPHLDFT